MPLSGAGRPSSQRRGAGAEGDREGESVLDGTRCPRCAAPIDIRAAQITCAGCSQTYPRLGDIPILLADPHGYLASCRGQLSLLERSAVQTVEAIQRQLRGVDVLPVTRMRLEAMIEGIRGQLADVRALLGPLLPGDDTNERRPPDTAVPATIQYLHYLYRDWGWPSEPDGENERAVGRLEALLKGARLGRTLVLGAGGCRLAYDLHRGHPDAEIVAVDIDPLLFAAARAVTRGDQIPMREANLEICEVERSSRAWTLSAPDGPVEDHRFHFVVADGVDPPFAQGSVDTVVTPWFLDQGPADARDLIGTVHGLLRPGGQWLNMGPLLYEPDVPIVRRFGREELFDLAARAGFRVHEWHTESAPYLVSKLNGRGKLEWLLSSAATKLMTPRDGAVGDGPPAWLVFGHVPVPTFPGQSMFWSKAPAVRMVVEAVDGRRTVDDIVRLLARQAQRSDVAEDQIRLAVRECLAEVHPAARIDV